MLIYFNPTVEPTCLYGLVKPKPSLTVICICASNMPSGCLGLAALIMSPRKSRQHNRNSSGINGYTPFLD